MFKAAVHSCVSCHNLLCLTCCSTWRRIKGEAFVTVSFCVLFDCVLVSVLLDSRASWPALMIEGDRVPISVVNYYVQLRWEVRMRRGFSAAGKLPVCSGDSLSVRDSSRLPISDSYHLIFIYLLLEGFSASHGLPCPSPIWAALFSCTFVGLPSACDWHTVLLPDPL